MGTLTPHEVGTPQFLPLAVGCLGDRGDRVAVLSEVNEFGADPDLDQIGIRSHLQGLFDQLQAVALQRVGEAGVAGQHGVVEHRYGLGVAAVPVMHQGGHQPAALEALVQADVVEHLQRGRVDRAGPANLVEEIDQPLDHQHPVAAAGQRQRQHQSHRTGASDQHSVVS